MTKIVVFRLKKCIFAYFLGIGYSLGRVPMAGCDFSWREYSYDDTDGDLNLTNFALQPEDLNFKVCFFKKLSLNKKTKILNLKRRDF